MKIFRIILQVLAEVIPVVLPFLKKKEKNEETKA